MFLSVLFQPDEITITQEPYQKLFETAEIHMDVVVAMYFTSQFLFLKECIFSTSSLSVLSVDKAFCEGADALGQHTA